VWVLVVSWLMNVLIFWVCECVVMSRMLLVLIMMMLFSLSRVIRCLELVMIILVVLVVSILLLLSICSGVGGSIDLIVLKFFMLF